MPGPFVGFLSPCLADAYVFVSTTAVDQGESCGNYLCLSHVALFQDLGYNLGRIFCIKLILEKGVGSSVECALSSVSSRDVISDGLMAARNDKVTYV